MTNVERFNLALKIFNEVYQRMPSVLEIEGIGLLAIGSIEDCDFEREVKEGLSRDKENLI